MTRRHIVLTTNFSPWSAYSGGGQRSTHFLASALAERGHRVSVVFTKPPWERVQTPENLPYRVAWGALPALRSRRAAPLRLLSALSVARKVLELARGDAPWVVHAQGEEGVLVPRALPACPFVLTPRYPNYPPALQSAEAPLERAWLWLTHGKYLALGHAARRADLVCPTSRVSAQLVQRVFDLDDARLRIVPNGVDTTFFEARRRPEASGGPLLFFGRLERSKGIDVLIEAFASSVHRERTLCVVGEGAALPWLRRAVAGRGLSARVELCSWESAPRLVARLERAALAVLPSREESFGNAMVEAMAAATPLITTSAGSLSEIVGAQQAAWTVAPGDVAGLTSAIDTLLASPLRAEALGQSGRAHVQRRFDWTAVAARYEELYEEAQRHPKERTLGPSTQHRDSAERRGD